MKNTTIKITTLTHNKIVKDEVIVMDKKITCRPCKEKNNWEIENEFGISFDVDYLGFEVYENIQALLDYVSSLKQSSM